MHGNTQLKYLGIFVVTILLTAASIWANTFTMTTCPVGLYIAPWTTPYKTKLCSIKYGNQRGQVIKSHHLPTSTSWEELNFLGLEEERVQILPQDGPPPYQSNTVHSHTIHYSCSYSVTSAGLCPLSDYICFEKRLCLHAEVRKGDRSELSKAQ
jgi:hypothetical protein